MKRCAIVACLACGDPGAPRALSEPPAPVSIEAPRPSRAPELSREGASLALAHVGKRTLAMVVDREGNALRAIDLDERREIGHVEVDRPGQVLALSDESVAVASEGSDAIEIISVPSLRVTGTISLSLSPSGAPAQPFALALSPDDETLYVGARREPAIIATKLDGRRVFRVPIERAATSLLATRERVFASSAASSKVTIVDLSTREARTTDLDGVEGDVVPSTESWDDESKRWSPATKSELEAIARHARALVPSGDGALVVHELLVPQRPDAFFIGWKMAVDPPPRGQVTVTKRDGYGGGGAFARAEFTAVSLLNERGARTEVLRVSGEECRLPRGARKIGERVVVACSGTSTVISLERTAHASLSPYTDGDGSQHLYGERTPDSYESKRSVRVPGGPDAIAPYPRRHPDGLVVSTLFGDSIALVEGETVTSIPFARPALVSAQVRRGQEIFHRSNDARISSDGRTCASCHVDGESDGIAWKTPKGLRTTPSLAGRVDRAGPFGWNGQNPDLRRHVARTITNNLLGAGLFEDDLQALVVYCRSMRAEPARFRSSLEARGRDVFDAECGSCHVEGGTDQALHDVGSGGRFETPSLLGIARSAPYFHDNRYATLEEVLDRTEGSMAFTGTLSGIDRAALLAYLRSL